MLLLALILGASSARGQDFYDVNVLRTVDLQFHDANWWTLLQQNYVSQTNILADLTVENVTYPDVGVRIRGNTSYTALPSGSQKVSLNIETDSVHPDQTVMGYKNLNFNNSFHDPTFCREVVYMNVLAKWIPCGRANHINLTLNGSNWGVYANVQQYDKTLLKEHFDDADGMRVKCANNPNGPGLQYVGTNPSSYSGYEIKDPGGFANPVAELIALCLAIDNTPSANWPTIDQKFAIDPSSWTVAFENLFSDDDSYVNKGADFVYYRNPIDGRAYLHQADGNETFTVATWAADFHFTQTTKPVLNNVLASTEMRGRYFAHLRSALAELDWAVLGPEFTARRNLIDAAVQADPKKLYSYTLFVNNFTTTVNLGGSPPFGGSLIGLQQFVTQRRANLLANPEVAAVAPTITNLNHSSSTPGANIYITANVAASTAIASVTLYYQPTPSAPYSRIAMTDAGTANDGAAGDGLYGVLLPVTGVGGQKVRYYVGATAAATFSPQRFEPETSELDPRVITFPGGAVASDVVINEFLASNTAVIQDPAGAFEDYVELYNKGTTTIDLSGKYMSDTLGNPTKWQFPSGVQIAPGQTLLIWADEDMTEGPTHADFKLSAGGEEIGLWDTDGLTLLDSVTFGPQVANVSTGRLTDGGSLSVTFAAPTPGTLNDPGCGLRTYDQLSPTAHTLDLSATGSGSISTTVNFTATGMQSNGLGYFALDFTPTHIPLSPTLVALMTGSIVIPLPTDASGSFTVPLFIPNDSGLIGTDVYVQVAGLSSTAVFTASNAVHLSVCP
ncbi:MAG: CotH kinase family protein [Planctomycetes bacterium]|nr:CotH kinase family protein [Planctomycetota bacterium]MCC7172112.1 CotH kinase family protein [Planctomycetota bacterium]